MPQTLRRKGGKVEVDRIFRDDGAAPVMGILGGQKLIVSPGQEPMPTVAQRGKAFFFLNKQLTPVRTLDDIKVIPSTSPFRKAAEDFILLQQKVPEKAERVVKTARTKRPKTLYRQHLRMRDVTSDEALAAAQVAGAPVPA